MNITYIIIPGAREQFASARERNPGGCAYRLDTWVPFPRPAGAGLAGDDGFFGA
jgi:hypothetical protein